MGMKRITARIEVTYPADDPETLAEPVLTWTQNDTQRGETWDSRGS